MPQNTASKCPHDLRPGITVCYHCRRDARLAASARRNASAKQLGIVLLILVPLAVVVVPKVKMLGSATSSEMTHKGSTITQAASDEKKVEVPPTEVKPGASAGEVVSMPGSTFEPVIKDGPVELSNGAIATRSGDTVVVDFDIPMLRTRRAAKFEDIVRRSLADVYGARMDSVLSAIPTGSIVQVEDLFNDLPQTGLRIVIGGGKAITVTPRVKMRDDGPLVVAYHAIVSAH